MTFSLRVVALTLLSQILGCAGFFAQSQSTVLEGAWSGTVSGTRTEAPAPDGSASGTVSFTQSVTAVFDSRGNITSLPIQSAIRVARSIQFLPVGPADLQVGASIPVQADREDEFFDAAGAHGDSFHYTDDGSVTITQLEVGSDHVVVGYDADLSGQTTTTHSDGTVTSNSASLHYHAIFTAQVAAGRLQWNLHTLISAAGITSTGTIQLDETADGTFDRE